jgi:hypothetical protein
LLAILRNRGQPRYHALSIHHEALLPLSERPTQKVKKTTGTVKKTLDICNRYRYNMIIRYLLKKRRRFS